MSYKDYKETGIDIQSCTDQFVYNVKEKHDPTAGFRIGEAPHPGPTVKDV